MNIEGFKEKNYAEELTETMTAATAWITIPVVVAAEDKFSSFEMSVVFLHSAEHSSPFKTFPSSHSSEPATIPSEHLVVQFDGKSVKQ